MELFLLRHSTTPGNASHRFVGIIDQPLAPQGAELALSTAPFVEQVEHIYRSPLLRCTQTASILWPGVEQTVLDDLREIDFGDLEGADALEARTHPHFQRWTRGESPELGGIEDCKERATEALKVLLADAQAKGYEKIGVMCHGGVVMALMAQWAKPAHPFRAWLPQNCGGYHLSVETEPLALQVLGYAGNLPKPEDRLF